MRLLDFRNERLKSMSVFARVAAFVVSFALGVGTAFLPSTPSYHHECPRFYARPHERFFTFEEGKKMLGRRVHWAKPSPYPNNTGRVVHLDMVVGEKFYVVIDWDVSPDKGEHRLAWFNREDYENFIIGE